jgi:NADPH-dependent ferric siderophore reductase
MKTRSSEVARVRRLSPRMVRVTFGGDDLADVASLGPDDHARVFFPDRTGQTAMEGGR